MRFVLLLMTACALMCCEDMGSSSVQQAMTVPKFVYFKDDVTKVCYVTYRNMVHFSYVPCTPEVEGEIARTADR